MWLLLLLFSIISNLFLIIVSRYGYFYNQLYVFTMVNLALFLLCYLNYQRIKRKQHILSFHQVDVTADSGVFSRGKSHSQKQSLKLLHQKFNYALHILKQTDFVSLKKGNKALYDKPWFLLLGAKQSGKSALIQASGLDLIDTDNNHTETALAASLNSLFHFSSDAVFIEADGDYVTEGKAHEEWLSLLKLLRYHRNKTPINGLILTIDIAEFLLLEEPQRNFRAVLFRERINEIIDVLGIVFPVYVVFNQCDKIIGFENYFADLSEIEKQQVFGTSLFTLDEQGWQSSAHMLRQRLTSLTKQLQLQLVDKLAAEQSLVNRTYIISFSQQFEYAVGFVGHFVEHLFKASTYKDQPFVAGVFFTSAADQQISESAFSVVTQHVGQDHVFVSRALPQQLSNSLASIFIKALFKDLVLPLQDNVKANRLATRFSFSLKATLSSSIFIGMMAGISFMLSAYFSLQTDFDKNRLVIDDLVKSISTEANDSSTLIQSLTLLRQRFLTLNEDYHEFEYLLPYLDLDEKRRLVKSEMQRLYFHVLNLRIERQLQPLLNSRMLELAEQWNNDAIASSLRREYYDLLKLSLMLSCDIERLDIPFATKQLVQLWHGYRKQSVKDDEISAFTELVSTYLHAFSASQDVGVSLQPWKSLKPSINLARKNLANPLTADELYKNLLDNVPLQPELTINTFIPVRFQSFVESNVVIPWLYSQAGWQDYVQSKLLALQDSQLQTEHDWVIAQQVSDKQRQLNNAMLEDKITAVKSRYFDDYASMWFDFVESIRYSRLANIQETQATLTVLASPNGLFRELINNITKHLYLFDERNQEGQAAQRIEALAKHFPLLNQLTTLNKRTFSHAMLTQLQRDMLQVNKDLFAIVSSYSVNDAALAYTGSVLTTHQQSQVKQLGNNAPSLYIAWYDTQKLLARLSRQSSVQLSYLLTEPLRQSWHHLFVKSRAALESKWQQQVYARFERSISGHYPFSKHGADLSLSQLSGFFNRHNGQLWQFVTRDLNPFIYDFKQHKQQRQWLGLSLGIDLDLLDTLRDADIITDGFFSADSEIPRINYQIKPTAKKSIAESFLHVNGYEYRYRNEPEEWRHFVWPSRLNTHQARVTAMSSNTGHVATLKIAGDWALFKLIDNADITPLSANSYRLNWPLQTRRGERLISDYKIKVKPSSFLFERQKLVDFSLPTSLFKAPVAELISSTLDLLPVDN